ncbi:MAG: hypothetical protein ACOX02_01585 [Acholeplasmatales bacterium]
MLLQTGGTKEDIAAIYNLMATGKLKPVLHEIKHEDLPKGLKDLEDHKVQGRLVVVYEK